MKKILLVDDLGIDVMLTRMALEGYRAGYRIAVANDGEEAYRMVTDDQFDLLLVDIKMPRVDGFELLERLNADDGADGARRVPAIILSGSGLAADRARARALGAIDYLQKPVDYSLFKEELKATLERHGLN
jgi:CheY-like chemotaxis protein